MGGVNKLYRLVRVSLMEKIRVRSSLKECVSHAPMGQQKGPDRGNSQGQGPQAEISLSYIGVIKSSMWLEQGEW